MFIEVNNIINNGSEKVLINVFLIRYISQVRYSIDYPESCKIYVGDNSFYCIETYTYIKTQMMKKIKEANDIVDRFKLMEFD